MNTNAAELTLNVAFKDWIFNVIMPSGIKTSTFETYESIYRLYLIFRWMHKNSTYL